MTRLQAIKIHAYHAAAFKLTLYFTAAVAALVLALGVSGPDVLALCAVALAFFAIMASVSTDMMSKRIPNPLSLTLLAAAPLWWIAQAMSSGIAAGASPGVLRDMLGLVGLDVGTSPLLPPLAFGFPVSIATAIAMMVVVFIPLFLSFRLGLGFGGGDVKLITAGSLFFGWPLGFDFLAASFLVGGVFSAFVILGRNFCRLALRMGVKADRVRRFAALREFPYAPAIAVAGIFCLAAMLEGLH